MGDSENSRTVPAITCRNLLKTTEWLLTAQIADQSPVSQGSGDDTLDHWRAWLGAFERLEAELLEASSLNVRRGDAGLRSLACVIAADDGRVEAYRQAEQAMEDAAEIEGRLASTLSAADGASIAAVVAKLHGVLQRGEHDPDFDAFPWPELSRVLDDLLNIDGRSANVRKGGVLQPIDSG